MKKTRTHVFGGKRARRLAPLGRARSPNNRGALQTIVAAVVLPLLVLVLMGTLDVVYVYRIDVAVAHAARVAAEIAGTPYYYTKATPHQFAFDVTKAPDVVLLDPKARTYFGEAMPQQCRQFAEDDRDGITTCIFDALTAEGVSGKVWVGYNNTVPANDLVVQQFPLPYYLYEEDAANLSYSPVMTLPQVQTRLACFEPFNETGATIGGSPMFEGAGAGAKDKCRLARTLTYSAGKADFDGDGREDAVFFKARGAGTSWLAEPLVAADVDFIAMKSGAAYSAVNGTEFANLTASASALPIVEDYDRDGRSDFAVFEPVTGNYRVRFSSCPGLIGSAAGAPADASLNRGYAAFPGIFTTEGQMQLAVIQTGGTAAARYNIYLSGTIKPNADCTFSNPGYNTLSTDATKPRRGDVAVPFASKMNGDGITKFGYLSYSGGNLTRKIAGEVESLATPSADAILSDYSLPSVRRLNPFDMDVDENDNVYIVDSVGGAILKGRISEGVFSGDPEDFVGGAARQRNDVENSEESLNGAFPKENVYNIPTYDDYNVDRDPDACYLATPDGFEFFGPEHDGSACKLKNEEVVLKTPRQIAVGDKYLYIADYGNNRILRTGIDDGVTTLLYANTTLSHASDREFWPMALAVIKEDEAENLAFSSGYQVFLLSNADSDDSSSMSVTRIAGSGKFPQGGNPVFNRDVAIADMSLYVGGDPVDGAELCPIVSMEWVGTYLYMASSCSVEVLGGGRELNHKWQDARPGPFISTGGILRLSQSDGAKPLFAAGTHTIEVVAGSFDPLPCSAAVPRCSSPQGGAGFHKRVIDVGGANSNEGAGVGGDLFATLRRLDIINPVDLQVAADGSVYFINQWNEGRLDYSGSPAAVRSNLFGAIAPAIMDRHHEAAVYKIVFNNHRPHSIVPLGSPFAFGQFTMPTDGEDWYAPFSLGTGRGAAEYVKYVSAFEAPAKLFDWPAAGGLTFDTAGHYLLTSTPFLVLPSSYDCFGASSDPRCSSVTRTGHIYSTALDSDLDGQFDVPDGDSDYDGDGDSNATDAEDACAPLTTATGTAEQCRTQEKTHLPTVSFFRLDGGTFDIYDGAGVDPGDVKGHTSSGHIGEFVLVNQVAECDQSNDCGTTEGKHSRSNPWALLFWYGNDQYMSNPTGCTAANNASASSPYWDCYRTTDGPFVVPQPLHTFVGLKENSYPAMTSVVLPGGLDNPIHENRFEFPFIFGSRRPRENQIGAPRRRGAYLGGKTKGENIPNVTRSGVLCWDYTPVESTGGAAQPGSAAAAPFTFGISDQFLYTQIYSGIGNGEEVVDVESEEDNDAFNYLGGCGSTESRDIATGGGSTTIFSEGLVLQLDHDDTIEKLEGVSEAPHWPLFMFTRTFAGDLTHPENLRQFLLLKNDEDETSDPTWLTTDVIKGVPAASRSLFQSYSMVSGALRGGSQYLNEQRRWPVSSKIVGFEPYFLPFAGDNPVISPYSNFGKILKDLPGSYDSTVFDWGKSIDDSLTESFIVGLDYEPFMKKVRYDPNDGADAWSVDQYSANTPSNYAVINRFRKISGVQPPSIRAARSIIDYQVPNLLFVEASQDDADLGPSMYTVTFLGRDQGPCSVYYDSVANDSVQEVGYRACHYVKVSIAENIFGRNRVITHVVPISNPSRFDDICDPNRLDGVGWRCSAGEVSVD